MEKQEHVYEAMKLLMHEMSVHSPDGYLRAHAGRLLQKMNAESPTPAPDALGEAAPGKLPKCVAGRNYDSPRNRCKYCSRYWDSDGLPGECTSIANPGQPAPPTPPAKVRRRMQANTEIGGSFFAHLVEHDESSECLLPPVCQPVPDPAPVAAEPPSIVDERPAEGRRWIVEENTESDWYLMHDPGDRSPTSSVAVTVREPEPITEARLEELRNLYDSYFVIERSDRNREDSHSSALAAVLRECGLTVEGK